MANDWLRYSCTYRAIYEEGFFEGFVEGYPEDLSDVQLVCRMAWLRHLVEKWLGRPSVVEIAKIEAISNESKLTKLVEKLTNERLKIATWDDLLAAR